jgi:hypothetical protein
MQIAVHNDITSGQVDPKYKTNTKINKTSSTLIVNGCAVTLTSSSSENDESLKAIRDILVSAYRTRMTRC